MSRWIDGVLEDKDKIDQPENLKAMVFWGHAPNSQTRLAGNAEGHEQAGYAGRHRPVSDHDGRHARPQGRCLSAAGLYAVRNLWFGTASNRSLQWREKVVDPLFESLPDQTIMYKLAKKLGFADELFKTSRSRTTSL